MLRDGSEDDVLSLFEAQKGLSAGRPDVVRVRGKRGGFTGGPALLPQLRPSIDVNAVLRAHSKTASPARVAAIARLQRDLTLQTPFWALPGPRGTADLLRRQIFTTVSLDLCDWFGMSANARRAEFAARLVRVGGTRRASGLMRETQEEIGRRLSRLEAIARRAVPVTYRVAGQPFVNPPLSLESGRPVAPGDTFTTSVLTLGLQDQIESGVIEEIDRGPHVVADPILDAANQKVLAGMRQRRTEQQARLERERHQRRARGANAQADANADRRAQRTTQRLVVDGRALLSDLGVWPWACFESGRLPGTRRNDWRVTQRDAEEALMKWLNSRPT